MVSWDRPDSPCTTQAHAARAGCGAGQKLRSSMPSGLQRAHIERDRIHSAIEKTRNDPVAWALVNGPVPVVSALRGVGGPPREPVACLPSRPAWALRYSDAPGMRRWRATEQRRYLLLPTVLRLQARHACTCIPVYAHKAPCREVFAFRKRAGLGEGVGALSTVCRSP